MPGAPGMPLWGENERRLIPCSSSSEIRGSRRDMSAERFCGKSISTERTTFSPRQGRGGSARWWANDSISRSAVLLPPPFGPRKTVTAPVSTSSGERSGAGPAPSFSFEIRMSHEASHAKRVRRRTKALSALEPRQALLSEGLKSLCCLVIGKDLIGQVQFAVEGICDWEVDSFSD